MAFELFRKILGQLDRPDIIRLNYSGESVHYPHLADAVRAAKSAGALTELVSAFSSSSEAAIRGFVTGGLDRLEVSVHTVRENDYRKIYGFSSASLLLRKLALLRAIQSETGVATPHLSFSIVAMDENIDQLPEILAVANRFGVVDVCIHPVIRRDSRLIQISTKFSENGDLSPEFKERLWTSVGQLRSLWPRIRLRIARPQIPARVVAGQGIATCEQNPWETTHILSNGDVVACEVQDKTVLGNLTQRSLDEIWRGAAYSGMRRAYAAGKLTECASCPWLICKPAAAISAEISALAAGDAQFLRGWQAEEGASAAWSRANSAIVLKRPSGGGVLKVKGMLPPSESGSSNDLVICCDGNPACRVSNTSADVVPFEVSHPLPPGSGSSLLITFQTSQRFSPKRFLGGEDTRELGLALIEASIGPRRWGVLQSGRIERAALSVLFRWLRCSDRLRMRADSVPAAPHVPPGAITWGPGVSILIPERGNVGVLAKCLKSLEPAIARVSEPVQIVVLVNGSPPADYAGIRARYPLIEFRFHKQPLGFSTAIQRGLTHVKYDWVYLLNSDALLEPSALVEALARRSENVFAVASRIHVSGDREGIETNLTRLVIAGNLVDVWDVPPVPDAAAQGNFYCGGGSSLFRTAVLKRLASKTAAYDPFYWEDVEWGLRARLLGYENVFCPESRVWHERRATIAKYFPAAEIERIFARNRLLFQLRNIHLPRGLEAIERKLMASDVATQRELLFSRRVLSLLPFGRSRVSARLSEDLSRFILDRET